MDFTNGWEGKGVWRDGSWVQLYNGSKEHDAQYINTVTEWVRRISAGVHKQNMLLVPNWSTYGAAAPHGTPPADVDANAWNTTHAFVLTNSSDGIVSEGGFVSLPDRCGSGVVGGENISSCFSSAEAFENNLHWLVNMQAAGKAILYAQHSSCALSRAKA